MIEKPLIKHHFQMEILKEKVYLFSENENFILKGRLYTSIASLMDGKRSCHEIADMLSENFYPAEVYYAFEIMEKKGYITEDSPCFNAEEKKFWNSLGFHTKDVEEKLKNTHLSLISIGNHRKMASLLKKYKIEVSSESKFMVVITDDYMHESLSEINRENLKTCRPWLLVKPSGLIPSIGPLFIPGKTACYECFSNRYKANREINDSIFQKMLKDKIMPSATMPFTGDIVYQMSVMEIARYIAEGKNERLEGKIISFNSLNLKTKEHILIKRPECNSCGNSHERSLLFPAQINLQSRKKTYVTDGDHRSCDPEATFEKYKHNISEFTGVIAKFINNTSGNKGPLHVYFSGHNLALNPAHIAVEKNSLRNLSAGKGMTDIQAKVSSLAEALERYSGIFRGDEYRIKSTYKKLGDQAIHPNNCMNYSKSQYINRIALNKRGLLFHTVPLPFDEDIEIEWSPVWSISKKNWKYLPTSYCYFGYRYKYEDGRDFFAWGDSNGFASGNTIEEAILHGFFELVERDAVAIWWYNKLTKPAVDLSSFNHPYIKKLMDYYNLLGRNLWVLDLTTDFNIPVFAAISMNLKNNMDEILFAFGCHFDPEIALLRSLCELNQFVSIAIDKPEHDNNHNNDTSKAWLKSAAVKDHSYLVPGKTIKRFPDYKSRATDDLLKDIQLCNQVVEELGMEMLVLDQTRADVGMNVVKVIVPGMRHMWERFKEGRLYDVPVKMRWLSEKKNEKELNPIGVFV
ncbi:MAG TPA: TOMM precursor leader peptide-binding protein [Candidatus Wallbacteria bacterium]|nr:TOMM precursor leader peptide-binding protein [Candidatus Wallbacteria bacterium]